VSVACFALATTEIEKFKTSCKASLMTFSWQTKKKGIEGPPIDANAIDFTEY